MQWQILGCCGRTRYRHALQVSDMFGAQLTSHKIQSKVLCFLLRFPVRRACPSLVFEAGPL